MNTLSSSYLTRARHGYYTGLRNIQKGVPYSKKEFPIQKGTTFWIKELLSLIAQLAHGYLAILYILAYFHC